MALNKLKFNSLNVTPVAGKTIGFNSDADGLEATLSGGSMRFIKKLTASSDSTLSFVDGSSDVVLDNTYKEYIFLFKDIHPSVDKAHFSFHGSTDSGSSYSLNHVSSAFRTYHNESGSASALQYHSDDGSTAQFGLHNEDRFQIISSYTGADNDQTCAGFLHLFNPSSTTFIKHYISNFSIYNGNNYSQNNFHAGYMNTASAIDAIRFKFANGTGGDNGNIDAGTITLYGIN